MGIPAGTRLYPCPAHDVARSRPAVGPGQRGPPADPHFIHGSGEARPGPASRSSPLPVSSTPSSSSVSPPPPGLLLCAGSASTSPPPVLLLALLVLSSSRRPSLLWNWRRNRPRPQGVVKDHGLRSTGGLRALRGAHEGPSGEGVPQGDDDGNHPSLHPAPPILPLPPFLQFLEIEASTSQQFVVSPRLKMPVTAVHLILPADSNAARVGEEDEPVEPALKRKKISRLQYDVIFYQWPDRADVARSRPAVGPGQRGPPADPHFIHGSGEARPGPASRSSPLPVSSTPSSSSVSPPPPGLLLCAGSASTSPPPVLLLALLVLSSSRRPSLLWNWRRNRPRPQGVVKDHGLRSTGGLRALRGAHEGPSGEGVPQGDDDGNHPSLHPAPPILPLPPFLQFLEIEASTSQQVGGEQPASTTNSWDPIICK
ncbi:hypothetical protein QYE76_018576, partial [Lolium multiflorum]